MTRLRDLITGQYTEGHEFEGTDDGGRLRAELRARPSVPEGQEIVVGSSRLYLPQQFPNPFNQEMEQETEIVQRGDWLIWSDEDERWNVYPPKLMDKYFDRAPEEDAHGE